MVNLNNKTILVTGGCGFIGSNFIEYINNNYNNLTIYNIDKHGIGSRDLLSNIELKNNNEYVEFHNNVLDIEEILTKYPVQLKFDYVFHFAAESHVDRSILNPSSFVNENSYGTSALLEYFLKYQKDVKIICISTDEVYGHLNVGDAPFLESTPLDPRSPYSASKAASDLISLAFQKTYGMNISVTRCCNNYGPHQGDEKFIPTIIRKLVRNEKIPVYGTGQNIREWIFVEDHNKGILDITDLSSNIYNIGSSVEKTNLELITDILAILYPNGIDINNVIEFVEDRRGHDFRYAIDSLHYKKKFELTEYKSALEKTVEFYKNKYHE